MLEQSILITLELLINTQIIWMIFIQENLFIKKYLLKH